MTRVVMVVGNDITTDTRVRKSALALSDAGYEVVVVCHASNGRTSDAHLGDVLIKRIPITFRRRERLKARIERRKQLIAPLARIHPRLHRYGQRGLNAAEKLFGKTRLGLAWPRTVPEALDTEEAFLDIIVSLKPDVLHAHDVQVMRIVALAADRLGVPWIYDAHEWVFGLSHYGRRTRRVVGAWLQLEEEWIGSAARVVTVSEPLAQALQQLYRLPQLPHVVHNAPPLSLRFNSDSPSVRKTAGIPNEAKVGVYVGGVTRARGLDTVIEALPEIPLMHFVLVAVPHGNTWIVQRMRARAKALGVEHRFHVLPPVAPNDVASFLRDADVGLIPLLHFPSHEMALTNKLFEYLHAGLPIVVSDCRAQADFVERHHLGSIHRAGDSSDLARAIRVVLDRPRPTPKAQLLRQWSWEPQAQQLINVYAELCGHPAVKVRARTTEPQERGQLHNGLTDPVTLAIGPANSAGQGFAWARAARRLPRVNTYVFAVKNGRYDFPCDASVDVQTFARNHEWAQRFESQGIAQWTHVLCEAGRPIFGTLNGKNFVGDLAILRQHSIGVGLVFHGSEIRNPERHAQQERWSPFAHPDDPLTARLQRQWHQLMPAVMDFDGPLFVSTPDLLDDLPSAKWLPVTVDMDQWWAPQRIIRRTPVVVHAPSNSALKGTAMIQQTLERLNQRGVLRYQEVTGVSPEQARSLIRDADLVLDQFALGSYGVLATQAMAAGKPVIGHVRSDVRERIGQAVPIIEANPKNLEQVLLEVLSNTDRMHEVGVEGQRYVNTFHDGTRASQALAAFLGRTATQAAGVALTLGTLTETAP